MQNEMLVEREANGLLNVAGFPSKDKAEEAEKNLSSREDGTLADLAREGSHRAFEELVLRHRGRVTRVALRFFPRLDDAEDVAQDTFVRAFLKLGKLSGGVPFENWVVRIAINLSLDRIRYSKRRPEHSISQLGKEEESWLERFSGGESVDDGERTAQNTEARNILDKVIPMISPKDQAILHLLYGEGMNSSEVAAVLGSSEVNIRVRAHRAKRALRRALEKLMDARPGTHGS